MKRTMKFSFWSTILLLLTGVFFSQCSKDDPAPAQGTISGKVTDFSSGIALVDVSVVVFNASTNAPQNTTTTNATGDYSIQVNAGTYFLKFYRQGYLSVPSVGTEPISFQVTTGQTATQAAQMVASNLTNIGFIKGKVSVGSSGQSGALVVAEGNGAAYSGLSDKDGNYTIFNIPVGSYQVKGFLAEYSSTSAPASVSANVATNDINITLTKNATGQVAGTFKVISQTTIVTPPTTMDISLVHALTRETVPGLSKSLPYSSSINYSFSNVPDGTYIVRATYANDYIVIDPDYITKFGDYKVTVSNGSANPASVDLVATSAVLLTSPTNAMTTTVPVDASATPTFQWSAYASTSDYIIEVTDAATGQVVWGGFTNSGGTITKNIIIPGNTTSATYNSDGKASSAQLTVGKIYRWRIYASKDNVQTGWNLIAASEDQMGLIKIK